MNKNEIKQIIDENTFWIYHFKRQTNQILIFGNEMPNKFKINDFSLRLNEHMVMCIGNLYLTVYYFKKDLSFYDGIISEDFSLDFVGNMIFNMECENIEKFQIYL